MDEEFAINPEVRDLFKQISTHIRSRMKLIVTPNKKIIFAKEKSEKPELAIITISASVTSLFTAQIVEKKAATGITKQAT